MGAAAMDKSDRRGAWNRKHHQNQLWVGGESAMVSMPGHIFRRKSLSTPHHRPGPLSIGSKEDSWMVGAHRMAVMVLNIGQTWW